MVCEEVVFKDVDLEEVVEGRRHVQLRTRPLQKQTKWMTLNLEMVSAGRLILTILSLNHPKPVLHKERLRRQHGVLSSEEGQKRVLFQIRWLDSQFHSAVEQFYPAPECVALYNANMQGVDRLDQIRGCFSTADGHSFKRWHKKLALALIDVARSNAYLTWRLVKPDPATRDPHRSFLMELVGELLNDQWRGAPSDGRMLYSGGMLDGEDVEQVDTPSSRTPGNKSAVLAETTCASVSSRQIYAEKSRKRRRCIVC
ncbi:hypothetical protein F444_22343 [Phytophthora nicotianae P1976]|uniref:PiggyBac transposable element-derived protein domain-containing protein n=1 Tax=Phytophthora nicotianae P1976 TaxID=1317066 RepID=A0A080YY23_PHYNI|nr:hypothetical protein F444_22343 [Phytophthora nicotianae P1976]